MSQLANFDSTSAPTPSIAPRSLRVQIDRGGTFADAYATWHDRDGVEQELVVKLLSSDPANYPDAPTEAIRRILEHVTQTRIPRGQILNTDLIDYVRLSTTVATNALLERKGERHALVITKGFGDLLSIGNQTRPNIFHLNIRKPSTLYSAVVEVNERVTLAGYASDPLAAQHSVKFDAAGNVKERMTGPSNPDGHFIGDGPGQVVRGLSGEAVRIIQPLDEVQVHRDLQQLYDNGYRSLAVVFIHSFTFPHHERRVAAIARELGFTQVSVSADLLPMIRAVPRGVSATADAYLTPVLKRYLDGFFGGCASVSHLFPDPRS